jgi:hypothetical protein
MHYSVEQHEELDQAYESVCEELTETSLSLARDVAPLLRQERAREHITYGAARRLLIIIKCVKNIFAIFPVRRTKLLTDAERTDLEISLHAFLIHVHGLPDNLAWAYILEREIPMSPQHVGLFQRKTREHFPIGLQAYLNGISNWHQVYAKNYRDALAHRIPPYVPPATWLPEHEQQFRDLHEQAEQAMRERNFELALQLDERKYDVGIIHPGFLHSFLDQKACDPVLLHPQVIVDARTILEIIHIVCPHLVSPKSQESG